MSFLYQTLHGLSRRLQQASRDSMQLVSMHYKNNSNNTQSFKETLLLAQSQDNNSIAKQLLRIEQQYALFKYHGLKQYLQQHLLLPTTSSTTIRSSLWWNKMKKKEEKEEETLPLQDNQDISSSSSNKQSIPLMITKTMRLQLTELGYSNKQVASLTPQQAHDILTGGENNEADEGDLVAMEGVTTVSAAAETVEPSTSSSQRSLSIVAVDLTTSNTSEHDQQSTTLQLKQHQQEERQDQPSKTTARTPIIHSNEQEQAETKNNITSLSSPSSQQQPSPSSSSFFSFLGSASQNQLLVRDPNRHNEQSATKRRWYQLIHQQQQQPDKDEHSPKDNVVGLYPTQEEAQEALQILQELAQKRQENIELTIVPVER